MNAGYTLNKAALKLLVTEILPARNDTRMKVPEDVNIALSFQNYEKHRVYPYPTRDKQLKHRYNAVSPMVHYNHKEPRFYKEYMSVFHMKWGRDHSSPQSVAFHYVKPSEMRHIHALKSNLCV